MAEIFMLYKNIKESTKDLIQFNDHEEIDNACEMLNALATSLVDTELDLKTKNKFLQTAITELKNILAEIDNEKIVDTQINELQLSFVLSDALMLIYDIHLRYEEISNSNREFITRCPISLLTRLELTEENRAYFISEIGHIYDLEFLLTWWGYHPSQKNKTPFSTKFSYRDLRHIEDRSTDIQAQQREPISFTNMLVNIVKWGWEHKILVAITPIIIIFAAQSAESEINARARIRESSSLSFHYSDTFFHPRSTYIPGGGESFFKHCYFGLSSPQSTQLQIKMTGCSEDVKKMALEGAELVAADYQGEHCSVEQDTSKNTVNIQCPIEWKIEMAKERIKNRIMNLEYYKDQKNKQKQSSASTDDFDITDPHRRPRQ